MEISKIKEHIYDNDLIETILEEIGCHHITKHGHYLTCGNPDGNNKAAITVYTDTENLTVVNYTRDILPKGQSRTTDIVDLVMWAKGYDFVKCVKYLCEICGLDYYQPDEELPPSLQILKMLQAMNDEDDGDEYDNTPLQPISEKILDYYLKMPNIMFEDDGISCATQRAFEIGYDPFSNSVTIPIRDELGSLVGIKARRFKYTQSTPVEKRRFDDVLEDGESKYFYLEPCNKSAVLYGLYQNIDMIRETGVCYIAESEKSVQQMYDMGYYGVASGGTKISKRQIDMLTRLGVKLIFVFDKDVSEEELKEIANRFIEGVSVYAVVDTDNILDEKESPSDNPDKWQHLVEHNIKRIR